VLFPAYAKLDRDPKRLRSAALRTLRLATAVFVPVGAGMAVVATPLVTVAFGRQWSDAAAVLPWMAGWAALTALTQHFGEVYKALGQTRILSWMVAVSTVLALPGLLWVGIEGWGLSAIVVVLIVARVVRVAFDLVVMRWLVDLRPAVAARAIAPALVAVGLMVGAVLAASRVIPPWPAPALLAALVLIGAIVYVVALAVLDRGLFAEVYQLLRAAAGGRALVGRDSEAPWRLS
jgi:O-antigen/teichoic acid export membrane protein